MALNFLDYRIRQRDYLLSIAQAMVSRLNVRAVLRLILQAAVDMLQGQSGLIALHNEGAPFTFWASYGLPPALVDAFQPLVEDVPIVEKVEDFTIPDLSDKLAQIAEETGLLLRQVVALPMFVEQDFLGVLFIFRSHSLSFSQDDYQILKSFADYAAIAVNNAQLYEAAVTERGRLDALLESSADGIMVLRPDLSIERLNRALASLTGWSAQEAAGRQHDEVIVWARQSSDVTLSQAIAQGWPTRESRTLYVEGEMRRRNGSVVSVGITYAPLLARNGRMINIISTVRDITRFREADVLKDTFISVVSHELKTPVSIIKGYAETLRRPEARRNPALVEEMLTSITEEADRLARLVDDLLDASRLQAGGLPFRDVEDVDLRFIARRVIERYGPQSPKHTLILDFAEGPSGEFPTIRGDPQRLEQVLDNLVSNAIKYSPRGGEVRIKGEATPVEVILSVSDQGVGIPLEDQERIFDRFYRVENPETRAVSGTGLGLYLTRAIVRAHGGRCWVDSIPGQGATFYIALPRETGLALWQGETSSQSPS
ncbi:MAG TPA: ATP-binding protein [Anaerolineae bacterium]|nr:ATP-binding protein [Anaerolineae bacterium]HQK12598.1 ATP-binding protein [Anaerolineae bacterium]